MLRPGQVKVEQTEDQRLHVLKEIFLQAQNLPKYYKLKVILETFVTIGLLCFLMLPMLFIALAIRLKMGSPIFVKQLRVGRFGVPFYLYKFRTMHANAQGVTALGYKPFTKVENDPRIAGVLGHLLRKYKIDELPQLFNVLLGDMCLLGPRPYIFEESVLIPEEFSIRYLVRPGISGPWQVWFSNSIEAEDKFQAEELYVKSMSFRQDFVLFFKTIAFLLLGERYRQSPATDDKEINQKSTKAA